MPGGVHRRESAPHAVPEHVDPVDPGLPLGGLYGGVDVSVDVVVDPQVLVELVRGPPVDEVHVQPSGEQTLDHGATGLEVHDVGLVDEGVDAQDRRPVGRRDGRWFPIVEDPHAALLIDDIARGLPDLHHRREEGELPSESKFLRKGGDPVGRAPGRRGTARARRGRRGACGHGSGSRRRSSVYLPRDSRSGPSRGETGDLVR